MAGRDCCDALFVPVSRERRLEIMKDPRLGGFGAAGLILLLLVKLAALHGVHGAARTRSRADRHPRPGALGRGHRGQSLSSGATGRYGGFLPPRTGPPRAGHRHPAFAALAAAPLLWRGAILWAAAVLALLAMASLARARLGGLTGDVYGAIIELAETAALVAVCFLA